MTVPELCVYTHNFFDRYDAPFTGRFIIGVDYIWDAINFNTDVLAEDPETSCPDLRRTSSTK